MGVERDVYFRNIIMLKTVKTVSTLILFVI